MVNILDNNRRTRDELGGEPEIKPIFKVKQESVVVEETPRVSISTTEGDSWIVGSSTNAIVGTWTGTENGGQLVVGPSNNDEAVEEVVLPNNTYNERFNIVADVKSGLYYTAYTFIDSGSTTATPSAANQNIAFTASQVAQSKAIKDDSETITTAIPSWTSTGTLTVQLSANNGSNWETVTSGTKHTFTNTGTQAKWKVTESGASTATISNLKIKFNQ